MLLCLVYTYVLLLSFFLIAKCFVSFILVQFVFTPVFMLQFCLLTKEEEEDNCNSAFHLINRAKLSAGNATQCWFADDAGAGGKLQDLFNWWCVLAEKDPLYG